MRKVAVKIAETKVFTKHLKEMHVEKFSKYLSLTFSRQLTHDGQVILPFNRPVSVCSPSEFEISFNLVFKFLIEILVHVELV